MVLNMRRIMRFFIRAVVLSLLIVLGVALNGLTYGAGRGVGSVVRRAIENGHTIIVTLLGIALLIVFVIASRRFGVKAVVNITSVVLICLPAFAITALIMSSIVHPSMSAKICVGIGAAIVVWVGSRRVGILKLAGYVLSMTMGFCGLTLVVFILWEMFLAMR
jgi:hypothetical protein